MALCGATDEGEDEDVIDIPAADKEADPLFGLRFDRIVGGQWYRCCVVDIVAGARSNALLYLVRYSDGELEHLAAEQIQVCLRAKPPAKAGSLEPRRAAMPVDRPAPSAALASGTMGDLEGKPAVIAAEGVEELPDFLGVKGPEVACMVPGAQRQGPGLAPSSFAISHFAVIPQCCSDACVDQVPVARDADREDDTPEPLVEAEQASPAVCVQCAAFPEADVGDSTRARAKDDSIVDTVNYVDAGGEEGIEVKKNKTGKVKLVSREGAQRNFYGVLWMPEAEGFTNGESDHLAVEHVHARWLPESLALLFMCLALVMRFGVVSDEARAVSKRSHDLQGIFDYTRYDGELYDWVASLAREPNAENIELADCKQRNWESRAGGPRSARRVLDSPALVGRDMEGASYLEEGLSEFVEERHLKDFATTHSVDDGFPIELSTDRPHEGDAVHDAVTFGQLFCRHRKSQGASGRRRGRIAIGRSCPAAPMADEQPSEAEACAEVTPGGGLDGIGVGHDAGGAPSSGEVAEAAVSPVCPWDTHPVGSESSDWSWSPIAPASGWNDSDTVDYADDPLALGRPPPGDASSSANPWHAPQAIPTRRRNVRPFQAPGPSGADGAGGGYGCEDSDPVGPRRSRAPTPEVEVEGSPSTLSRLTESTESHTDGSVTVLSSHSAAFGVRRRRAPASPTDGGETVSTDSGVHVGSRRRRRGLPHDAYHLHQEFLTATAALAADVAAHVAAEAEAEAGRAAAGTDRHQEFLAATAALAADVAAQVAAEDFQPEFLVATAALVADLAAEEEAAAACEAAETERLICAMLDRDEKPDHAAAEVTAANLAGAGEAAGNDADATAEVGTGEPGLPQGAAETGNGRLEATDRPGRAASGSGISEGSDINESHAGRHADDATGLVQRSCAVDIQLVTGVAVAAVRAAIAGPTCLGQGVASAVQFPVATQQGAFDDVALAGRYNPGLSSGEQADGLSAGTASDSHGQDVSHLAASDSRSGPFAGPVQVGCFLPDTTSIGLGQGVGGHMCKASISQGQGAKRVLANGGQIRGCHAGTTSNGSVTGVRADDGTDHVQMVSKHSAIASISQGQGAANMIHGSPTSMRLGHGTPPGECDDGALRNVDDAVSLAVQPDTWASDTGVARRALRRPERYTFDTFAMREPPTFGPWPRARIPSLPISWSILRYQLARIALANDPERSPFDTMADVLLRHGTRIALHMVRTMPVMVLQAVAANFHYLSPADAIRAVLVMATTSSVGGKTRRAALAAIVFSMRVVLTRSSQVDDSVAGYDDDTFSLAAVPNVLASRGLLCIAERPPPAAAGKGRPAKDGGWGGKGCGASFAQRCLWKAHGQINRSSVRSYRGKATASGTFDAGGQRCGSGTVEYPLAEALAKREAVLKGAEDEDFRHSLIAGGGPAGAGEAVGCPDVAEEHLDVDGPGDGRCGLGNDQLAVAKDDNVCVSEALHHLAERNRGAVPARRRARVEEQLRLAVAYATSTVQDDGGVVSITMPIPLPGFATR